ncbi:MAG: tyrosine-type recombinase/integrase [Desulfobacteraceae bacterium]|nr:tyrosine-type recombinase/integrase [Desulfobacteraceae bacterium]
MKAYIEPEDVNIIEQAASNLRDKLLIRTLFHLGCRITEALELTVDDIDFIQGNVTIVHLKRRVKISCSICGVQLGMKHSFCPMCGVKITRIFKEQEHRRQRTLPIDNPTLEMIKEYVKRGGLVIKDNKKMIFGINRHRAWQIIKECAEKVGLPKLVNPETGKVHNVSPHKFRDAFAIHAIKLNDSGDGLRMLQEHLGHQSFNTTAKYRKISGKEQKEWYEKLWEGDRK